MSIVETQALKLLHPGAVLILVPEIPTPVRGWSPPQGVPEGGEAPDAVPADDPQGPLRPQGPGDPLPPAVPGESDNRAWENEDQGTKPGNKIVFNNLLHYIQFFLNL